MKKLKIFLPILLISLFFIPKVNALTTTYNATLKYSDTFINTINNNQERINNLRSYISNLNCLYNNNYCVNTGNYIMIITGSTMNSDSWQVRIVTTNATNDYITAWWRTSYSDGRLLMTGNGITYNFNFTGNNVTSYNNRSTGGFNYIDSWNTSGWSGNPMNNNIEIELSNYIDTYFLNENRTINFKTYGQSGFYDIPIELNNEVKTPTVSINAKELFDSLLSEPNPYACSINLDTPAGYPTYPDSSVTNISNFEKQVTATGLSSQDYCIESSFALYNSSSTLQSGDTFDLEFIKGPNSIGEYNVNGSFTTNTSYHALIINYNVCATGSEPANVDVIIKVTPVSSNAKDFFKGRLEIMYCVPPDTQQSQDLNIGGGYAYTDDTTGLTNSYDTSLMNFLNNNSGPNLSFFSNLNTVLPRGPVDSILTLPYTMLSSISNAIGDTCNPITFTIPYLNEDIIIPCMNTFYDNIGATALFNVIGGIASVLILGEYFIFLYNWVDNTLRFGEHRLRMWGASVK